MIYGYRKTRCTFFFWYQEVYTVLPVLLSPVNAVLSIRNVCIISCIFYILTETEHSAHRKHFSTLMAKCHL